MDINEVKFIIEQHEMTALGLNPKLGAYVTASNIVVNGNLITADIIICTETDARPEEYRKCNYTTGLLKWASHKKSWTTEAAYLPKDTLANIVNSIVKTVTLTNNTQNTEHTSDTIHSIEKNLKDNNLLVTKQAICVKSIPVTSISE